MTVSIVLATYNPDPRLLRMQISSLREQRLDNWTCLVVDDCSDEPAQAEIRELIAEDSRFIFSPSEFNVGFCRNFERGLELAKRCDSQFIALSDQDDSWFPTKLARQVELMEKHGLTLCYHPVDIVTDAESRGATHTLASPFPTGQPSSLLDILIANPGQGWTMLFKRELLDVALPFPENQALFHDHWLICCAAASGRVGRLSTVEGNYVQHARNVLGGKSLSSYFLMRQCVLLLLAPVFRRGFFDQLHMWPVDRVKQILAGTATEEYDVRRRMTQTLAHRLEGVVGSTTTELLREAFPEAGAARWLATRLWREHLSRRARGTALRLLAGVLART